MRSELLVLGALAVAAFAPLAYMLERARRGGLDFAGADGRYPDDQFYYMAVIRDAGQHVFAADLFDLSSHRQVFLHPMFTLSAGLWRLGLSIQASYLLWKPVALAVLFIGCVAYTRRLLPVGWQRLAALIIALFYIVPVTALLRIPGWGSSITVVYAIALAAETYSAWFLSGYYPAAIAIGLTPLFLIGLERMLDPQKRNPRRGFGWYALWTAGAGVLVSWLHPWQGQVLILVVAGLVVWGPDRRRQARLMLPLAAMAVPLLYYLVLPIVDQGWAIGRAHEQFPPPPPLAVVLVMLPLAAPALLVLRPEGREIQERLLRLWPLAILLAYLLQGPFVTHVFEGAALPLGVLAVRGYGRVREGVIRWRYGAALTAVGAVTAVGLVTLPGTYLDGARFREIVTSSDHTFFLRPGEKQALDYVAGAPGPGGVLTPYHLGQVVPALTGRATWIGHGFWTPDFGTRLDTSERLFDGRMTAQEAQRAVADSGARFLLSDCNGRADVSGELGNQVIDVRRFSCATVYEVRPA